MRSKSVILQIVACLLVMLLGSSCSATESSQKSIGAGPTTDPSPSKSPAQGSSVVSGPASQTPKPDKTGNADASRPACENLSFIGKFKDLVGPAAVLSTSTSSSQYQAPGGFAIACIDDIGLHKDMTADDLLKWTSVTLYIETADTQQKTCAQLQAYQKPDPSAPGSFYAEYPTDGITYVRCTGDHSKISFTVGHGPANGVNVTLGQAAQLVSAVQAALPEVSAMMVAYCAKRPAPCH